MEVELHDDDRQERELLEHDDGSVHDRGGRGRQSVRGEPSAVTTVQCLRSGPQPLNVVSPASRGDALPSTRHPR